MGRRPQTMAAGGILARRARTQTSRTTAVSAGCAATDAIVAILVVTARAVVPVVAADGPAAVVAGGAVPTVQRDVRAAWVVLLQDAADQTKGIGQPALRQSFLQRDRGVPGAKFFFFDMRMCDGFVGA